MEHSISEVSKTPPSLSLDAAVERQGGTFAHRALFSKARDEVREFGRIMADTAARLMGQGVIVGQLESRLLSQAGMA